MGYVLIALAVLIADGLIKSKIEKEREAGEILPVLHGRIWIRKFHNTGAMFSLAATKQKTVEGISVMFTIFMTGVFVATLGYKGNTILKSGLALLLGGAYSNTYDRIMRKYVVDYVSFPVKNQKIRNLVFNISDFAIMIGALIICIRGIQES